MYIYIKQYTFTYRTWRNAQIGESVIEKLEEKGKEMAQERQEMIGKIILSFLNVMTTCTVEFIIRVIS